MTVAEAATALGISQDAVRKRIKRDSIRYEHAPGGRVYVYLDASQTEQDTGQGRVQDRTDELIATLREQLQAERQAHSEARRLLAAALERIPPQIEAPSDPRGAPERGTDEQQGRGSIPEDTSP